MALVLQQIVRSGSRPALGIIIAIAAIVGLARPAAQPPRLPQMLSAAEMMTQFALAGPEFVIGDQEVDGAALFRFYQARDSRLAWSDGVAANTKAEMVLHALMRADDHGLDASNYHLEQLVYPLTFASQSDAAVYDLLMTDAVLKYARDLRLGQAAPSDAHDDVNLPPHPFDAVSSLEEALGSGTLANFLDELAPPHPEYLRLVKALVEYRNLSAGDQGAVEHIAQIKANMERWRWLPRQLERRYVMINVADATLQLIEDGQVVLESKVIVGKTTTPTPIFRAIAREVTANPPWNVPSSIARNEILPKLRRNPNYLASQRMIILDGPPGDPNGTRIDWKKVSAAAFPYRLQQLPGPSNALGILKFEMPNGFSVYLHDTPDRSLFARSTRTLSHGCIRVDQIRPLALAALAENGAMAIEQLDDAIATGETTRFPLKEPLPVYVAYWTAFSGRDGTMQFRADVYGRDRALDLHQVDQRRKG